MHDVVHYVRQPAQDQPVKFSATHGNPYKEDTHTAADSETNLYEHHSSNGIKERGEQEKINGSYMKEETEFIGSLRGNFYTARPKKSRSSEEVAKILDVGVVEQPQSTWAPPVQMTPKEEVSYWFFVYYRKRNDINLCDTHLFSRMDECIDSLWTEKHFST